MCTRHLHPGRLARDLTEDDLARLACVGGGRPLGARPDLHALRIARGRRPSVDARGVGMGAAGGPRVPKAAGGGGGADGLRGAVGRRGDRARTALPAAGRAGAGHDRARPRADRSHASVGLDAPGARQGGGGRAGLCARAARRARADRLRGAWVRAAGPARPAARRAHRPCTWSAPVHDRARVLVRGGLAGARAGGRGGPHALPHGRGRGGAEGEAGGRR